MVGGVDSRSVSPQFRRGGARAVPPSLPDCNECHELETLMPPRSPRPIQPVSTEPSEEQSLMGNPAAAEDSAATEIKVRET